MSIYITYVRLGEGPFKFGFTSIKPTWADSWLRIPNLPGDWTSDS